MTLTARAEVAVAWTCPHCKRRNLCETVDAEITDEMRAEWGEQREGEPEFKTGNWATYPPYAECAGCNRDVRLLDAGETDDVEGDE